ncbi:MAG TPA: type 1 glutamine amidotransferase domain-containing protein [Candidatus Saccharimonadales bacterium]|nr:type 1 glutamine amidotransferase domain-containing protein [Candidatus Saccharimonadales bacterium]
MSELQNKRIAIIATDYFEEAELVQPLEALQEAGATVDVIAPHEGTIKGLNHVDPGKEVPVTKTFADADPNDYDGLIVPGGAVNADNLRVVPEAQDFLIAMLAEQEKPTAIICHGPWLLASTGLARGRKLTSFHTIKDDLLNAGAEWVDEAVVQDGTIITSRQPDDLPVFIDTFKRALSERD